MKTILFLSLFINFVIYQADCNHGHKRHKNIHANRHGNQNEHGRRIRRQWSSANYRSYSSLYHQDFYVNREEQLVSEILSLLRQIKLNLSSQRQQTFQPIYVPYAYPVLPPGNKKQVSVTTESIPALPNRNNFDADEEYSTPNLLKLVTKPSIQTQSTEAVTNSENAIVFPTAPTVATLDSKIPAKCEAAIITCCRFPDPKDVKACFSQYSCNNTYKTNVACNKKIIQTVVDKFIKTYAPK